MLYLVLSNFPIDIIKQFKNELYMDDGDVDDNLILHIFCCTFFFRSIYACKSPLSDGNIVVSIFLCLEF